MDFTGRYHWALHWCRSSGKQKRAGVVFAGKETALAFIAGMAITLARNNPQYRRGVKMNKTAIARVATQAMFNAGFSGEMVTEKQMSNLISEALLVSLPGADNP